VRYAGDDPVVREGLVTAPYPGLRLAWTDVEAAPARTPRELRDRLRAAADRIRGPDAIELRRRDVPHAYRVFFRHIGIEPDEVPTPVEAIVRRRLRQGGLPPQGLVEDALTVAVLETGVALWAFDAERVEGDLHLRPATPGEDGPERLVIADAAGPVAVLFEPPAGRAAVTRATRRIALVAVAVPGVPDLSVQEALWTAWDILA